MAKLDQVADALREIGISPDAGDSNLEPANLVDVIDRGGHALRRIADAITVNVGPGHDEAGGHIECLTEAVMGVTAGLCRIASALEAIAAAISDRP